MKTAEEIKRGDYVEIIPNEDHTTYIKGHYGKSHKVTRVTIWKGLKYYKLKGIKGNGPESSIKKINKALGYENKMPVDCSKCGEWVELDTTREGPITKNLVCRNCFAIEEEARSFIDEAKDISYDLENYAEHMKGDRRGWKNNLKELKEKISALGYSFEDYD